MKTPERMMTVVKDKKTVAKGQVLDEAGGLDAAVELAPEEAEPGPDPDPGLGSLPLSSHEEALLLRSFASSSSSFSSNSIEDPLLLHLPG